MAETPETPKKELTPEEIAEETLRSWPNKWLIGNEIAAAITEAEERGAEKMHTLCLQIVTLLGLELAKDMPHDLGQKNKIRGAVIACDAIADALGRRLISVLPCIFRSDGEDCAAYENDEICDRNVLRRDERTPGGLMGQGKDDQPGQAAYRGLPVVEVGQSDRRDGDGSRLH